MCVGALRDERFKCEKQPGCYKVSRSGNSNSCSYYAVVMHLRRREKLKEQRSRSKKWETCIRSSPFFKKEEDYC